MDDYSYANDNFDPMNFDNPYIDQAPQEWQDQGIGQVFSGDVPSSTNWNPNTESTQWDNVPMFGLEQGQFQTNAPSDWGQIQMTPSETMASGGYGANPSTTNWNPNAGGIQAALANIFNGMGTKEGKGALTGLGALVEGMQNKKKSAQTQQLVQQQQQRLDPFGSQRPVYQQALQQTMQNPYQQPMVAAQVEQIARAQAMKDAQAGRRSNSATSSPAMLAAQAQVAQQYMNSLMQPAGAGINPNSAGLSELLAGQNAGINGYMSPLLSAGGYLAGTATNSAQMNRPAGSTQYTPEEMAAIIKYTQGNK